MQNRFQMYLEALKHPFQKITRIEFLNPDDSVAFFLDNNYKRGYRSRHDSRAFVQGGTLNVSLQNGIRRKASVTISNLDDAFSYSVNNLWFGERVRLSMGMILPDGTEFYLPQGVFYLSNPQTVFNPTSRQVTYSLVDKWAYLDGSLFGRMPYTYIVERDTNIFSAMQGVLRLSKKDFSKSVTDKSLWLDPVPPVFTAFYNDLPNVEYEYKGEILSFPRTNTGFEVTNQMGETAATLLLSLNDNLVSWIGYDPTGTLRVEPSQDDVLDGDKAILWSFSPQNSNFLGMTESAKNTEVYNDIIISGEGMDDYPVYGRATNYDPLSDTNVNLIGLKTYKESGANYYNVQQCIDLASWKLKRQSILQKSVSIQSSQMFHLMENRLVTVQRTDKKGAPIERHLIQSFSLPLGETGSMTINATSVNDYQIATTTSSINEETEE